MELIKDTVLSVGTKADCVVGPSVDGISVTDFTATTAGVNLAATTELGARATEGFITFLAETEDVYYFFSATNAGTVDPAARAGSNPSNRCFVFPKGIPVRLVLPQGKTWIRARAATSAAVLRAYISSP